MKIIKNSHSGMGGIATESVEMLNYLKKHPECNLSLVHRDPNNLSYFKRHERNVTVHHLIVSKDYTRLIDDVVNAEDFSKKHRDKVLEIERIIESDKPEIALCVGTFYYPWFLLQAAKNQGLPIAIRYAGLIDKEETSPLWHEIGKDFLNPEYPSIFPSSHAKETLEEIHGIKLPDSYVVHNGVSEEFFRHKGKPSNDRFKIAVVGRLHEIKNLEFLAKLAKVLKKSNVQADYLCVTEKHSIDFPNTYQRNVLKMLEEEGVKVFDYMPHEELADFYRSVDLIITPSHFETFGNVPLEAITTGTPAIVNRTVGVKGALEKVGLEDFVVDINNMDSVVKKIKSIKDKRIIVDKETSNKIIERYNWESVMGEYFEVLRKCLENQQASITAT